MYEMFSERFQGLMWRAFVGQPAYKHYAHGSAIYEKYRKAWYKRVERFSRWRIAIFGPSTLDEELEMESFEKGDERKGKSGGDL